MIVPFFVGMEIWPSIVIHHITTLNIIRMLRLNYWPRANVALNVRSRRLFNNIVFVSKTAQRQFACLYIDKKKAIPTEMIAKFASPERYAHHRTQ